MSNNGNLFCIFPISNFIYTPHSYSLSDEKESSQFVPFLSEVRVGQFEEDMESCIMSMRLNEETQVIYKFMQVFVHPTFVICQYQLDANADLVKYCVKHHTDFVLYYFF